MTLLWVSQMDTLPLKVRAATPPNFRGGGLDQLKL